MAIMTANVIIVLIVLLVFLVGCVVLQIFLSRRENKWLGLILPGLSFLGSLVPLLSLMAYDSAGRTILAVLALLLLGNIPTLIMLAIYWASREKWRVKNEIDKMNIKDL